MRGVGSDGLGAKGGVACSGSAPIYPTIQARGFTPVRVGKTTGANPGGYQAIAMGGISQGDHRRLCHRPVPPCGAAFGGDSQRHLGAYGVDLSRHGPRVPVDSASSLPTSTTRTRTESSGGEGLGRPLPGAGRRRALPASTASTVGRGETPWLRRRCGTPCSTGTERVSAAKSSPAGARVSADRG